MARATERILRNPPPTGVKPSKLSYLLNTAEEWAKSGREPTADEVIVLRELILHIAPK